MRGHSVRVVSHSGAIILALIALAAVDPLDSNDVAAWLARRVVVIGAVLLAARYVR